jgi:signal peptide peptidase SppA
MPQHVNRGLFVKGISFEPAKKSEASESAEGFVLAGDLYAVLLGELKGRIWAMEEKALQAFFGELREFSGSQAQICTINVQAAQMKAPKRESKMRIDGGIATIPISGLLLKNIPWILSLFGIDATSYIDIHADVANALADNSVKRIILKIDSPGGEVAGVQEAADAIFEARAKKPVDTFIDDLGCSGAYWLGSQANTISANTNAEVGSIGVYGVLTDYSKAAENAGIKIHVIRSGEHKGVGVTGAEITEEQIAAIQQLMDDIGQNFVAAVARGRNQPISKVAQLATGQVWLAERAKGLGLIDGIESWETFLTGRVKTMADERTSIDAEVLNEEAIRAEAAEEAVAKGKTRLAELKAAFSDDLAFAVEQFEKDASLTDAKAAYAEVLKVKLAAEKKANAEMVKGAEGKMRFDEKTGMWIPIITASGAQAVEFHEAAQGEGDFLTLAQAKAKEEKTTVTAAMRTLAKERPDLHVSFVQAQKRNRK